MVKAVDKRVAFLIADANTPAKAWKLFDALLNDANGYSDETYLENARAYSEIAKRLYAEKD